MARLFYHTMQDNAGNLLFGVTGTMRLAGTGTLATIYGDEALTVILPNPMTNHPSYGSFRCFLPTGDFDFAMAKAGYSFETLSGVQGYGTMAQQDAGAVAITGGTAIVSQIGVGRSYASGYGLVTDVLPNIMSGRLAVGGNFDPTVALDVAGAAKLSGTLGIGAAPIVNAGAYILFPAGNYSLIVRPVASGPVNNVLFQSASGSTIGSITTNDTTTAYNTTSDARLKHDVADLTGELATVQALRPVRFTWNADGSEGHGFLAHEVAAHVNGIITGEADAVDEDGAIRPQQIDYSKLVPWLVGAIKTLAARLAVLEDALGI